MAQKDRTTSKYQKDDFVNDRANNYPNLSIREYLTNVKKPSIRQYRYKLSLKTASCNLIFHNGGELYFYRQNQAAYDKAFKAAGLPNRSTHMCRHTGATCFLEETGDSLALQQLGNRATQKQALDYGHAIKD